MGTEPVKEWIEEATAGVSVAGGKTAKWRRTKTEATADKQAKRGGGAGERRI